MATAGHFANQINRIRCAAGYCGRGFSLICLSALSGILAPLIFTVVMTIVQYIQPGYDPMRDPVSRLVLGAHGWFQTLSFFIFGFLFAVFSVRLYLATLRSRIARTGAALLFLSGFSFFMVGVFPVDPEGQIGKTVTGMVHAGMADTAASTFVLGSLAFAIYFHSDERWHNYHWFTLIIALAYLGFALVWILAPDHWVWKGLAQRFVLLIGFLWIEVISIRLLRFCIGKRPSPDHLTELGEPSSSQR